MTSHPFPYTPVHPMRGTIRPGPLPEWLPWACLYHQGAALSAKEIIPTGGPGSVYPAQKVQKTAPIAKRQRCTQRRRRGAPQPTFDENLGGNDYSLSRHVVTSGSVERFAGLAAAREGERQLYITPRSDPKGHISVEGRAERLVDRLKWHWEAR